MIEELKVSGFRSLKDVTWRPGRLNVVIGPNGSGKSNLLKAVDMLKYSALGRLSDFLRIEGGIDAISWDGTASSLSAEVTIRTIDFYNPVGGEKSINYSISMSFYRSNTYTVGSEELTEQRHGATEKHFLRGVIEAVVPVEETKPFIMKVGADFDEDESLLSKLHSPFIKNSIINITHEILSNLTAFRSIDVGTNSEIRTSAVSRYETEITYNAQNLINVLHTLYTTDREFKQIINKSMTAAFGQDFDELTFPPASDQRIQMRVRWKTLKREQSTADLSDGTLRFLFLATVLANPNPPPLIAIDEPETGLHPSMLPLVAELAANASLRSQVIFTTHSDQFLDAFNEAWEKPTVTVAKWENGETSLSVVDGDELKNWLEDYSLGALYRSGGLESGLI